MSKCSKDKHGAFEEKLPKDKKSKVFTLSGKKKTQDTQSKDRKVKKGEAVKRFIGSLESSKSSDDCIYNVDDLSSEDLHDSLHRISENPAEPFKFLNHILDNVDAENHSPLGRTKPTDIDLQLASLVKRVEMNKSLLERTNQRVKDINFIVEKNKIMASRELDYDKDSLSKMGDYIDHKTEPNIEHPGIDALQRTMKDTLQMLECIKKVSTGAAVDELSSEFFCKMELGSSPRDLEKRESNQNTKTGP